MFPHNMRHSEHDVERNINADTEATEAIAYHSPPKRPEQHNPHPQPDHHSNHRPDHHRNFPPPPQHDHDHLQKPLSPPPNKKLHRNEQAIYRVDPGAINACLYTYTYIWLKNGRSFWLYPIYIGRSSIAGYRWTGYSWVYSGYDLHQIESFECI